jgi:hypothetical protein
MKGSRREEKMRGRAEAGGEGEGEEDGKRGAKVRSKWKSEERKKTPVTMLVERSAVILYHQDHYN